MALDRNFSNLAFIFVKSARNDRCSVFVDCILDSRRARRLYMSSEVMSMVSCAGIVAFAVTLAYEVFMVDVFVAVALVVEGIMV